MQLNYIQVFRADDLNSKTTSQTKIPNDRPIVAAFARPRGTIATADGKLLAHSVTSDDRFKFRRIYPEAELYGGLTGYLSYVRGATGLERAYNEELSGRTARQQVRSIGDLFS